MTNPTRAVNPSAESLAALAALKDDDPIVMVNLLKFRERAEYADGRETDLSGREAVVVGRSRLVGRPLAQLLLGCPPSNPARCSPQYHSSLRRRSGYAPYAPTSRTGTRPRPAPAATPTRS